MARDITLRATWHELVGDETYELWLKRASGPWLLDSTGDVVADEFFQQEFVLYGLDNGVQYRAQIRAKRAGRYRVGYLTASPDTWPGVSGVSFVAGALSGVGPVEVASAVWARTSSTTTQITVNLLLADVTKSTKLYRDDLLIATLAPGVSGYVDDEDDGPELGVEHTYRARHTNLSADGPFGDPFVIFAGPTAPDYAQSSALDHFGSYSVTWDGSDPVLIEDDFACADDFTLVIDEPGPAPYERAVEDHDTPVGDTAHAVFHSRIRRKVTSFTVEDLSAWHTIQVECDIEETNTEYNSCP